MNTEKSPRPSNAAGEAGRRRRAQVRKAQTGTHVTAARPREGEPSLDDWWVLWCPDQANHKTCPNSGDGRHDWYKPHPRPEDHKYECEDCGHYDLDDYM